MDKNKRERLITSLLTKLAINFKIQSDLSEEVDEEEEIEDTDLRFLIDELDLCLESQPYSDIELLGLFIKHEREAADLSRIQLGKKAYLSLEVIMALELGLYDKDEILLEWLDRVSYVLNLNYEQLKSLITKHNDKSEDLPYSETHKEFYQEIVFTKAHNQYENGAPIFYEPYQFLIDQLASCLRNDEQVKITQRWLKQQEQKRVYVGQSLIELALSSLPRKTKSIGNYCVPIQTDKIRIDEAAFADPYEVLISWISYHKDYKDLITIIKYSRDLGVSVGDMLLSWSRNALEIKTTKTEKISLRKSIRLKMSEFFHFHERAGFSNVEIALFKDEVQRSSTFIK